MIFEKEAEKYNFRYKYRPHGLSTGINRIDSRKQIILG